MKIQDPPYPFDNFACYKQFHKKMGRWQVHLVDKTPLKRRTSITYAKYLMSIKEGRILTREEEVDHINGDKSDDRIENLQILSKEENRKKQSIQCGGRKAVELTCPYCGIVFVKEVGLLTEKRKNRFCSRRCNGKFKKAP